MSQFNQRLKSAIVKGIVAGYKDYVEVRKNAQQKLKISNAYAFVKANHIDHHVACQTEAFVDATKKSAGPSWKFLLFSPFDQQNDKIFHFVVVNGKTFDKNKVNQRKRLNVSNDEPLEKKYLTELMELNRDVDFEKLNESLQIDHQLTADETLFEMINNVSNGKIKFIIVTYDVDENSKMLSGIKAWIPHPKTNTAVEFLNLTEEMNEMIKNDEHYHMSEEEVEILKQDKEEVEWIDSHVFGFEIETPKESEQY